MNETTFVMIHGAADAAANWEGVAAELRERGHGVVAVDLPCEDDTAGLDAYADTVVEAIGDRRGLVVVAHSLGGFTAPLVCARVPAELLVLVAAMVPAPGETAADWWGNTGHDRLAPTDEDEIALFLHDAPPEAAQRALALARDQSERPMRDPWPLEAWPDVPTAYLLCRDDRFFPAAWTRGMVRERLGVEPDEMPGSHCAYVSRPRELAERLVAYAASPARRASAR